MSVLPQRVSHANVTDALFIAMPLTMSILLIKSTWRVDARDLQTYTHTHTLVKFHDDAAGSDVDMLIVQTGQSFPQLTDIIFIVIYNIQFTYFI